MHLSEFVQNVELSGRASRRGEDLRRRRRQGAQFENLTCPGCQTERKRSEARRYLLSGCLELVFSRRAGPRTNREGGGDWGVLDPGAAKAHSKVVVSRAIRGRGYTDRGSQRAVGADLFFASRAAVRSDPTYARKSIRLLGTRSRSRSVSSRRRHAVASPKSCSKRRRRVLTFLLGRMADAIRTGRPPATPARRDPRRPHARLPRSGSPARIPRCCASAQ